MANHHHHLLLLLLIVGTTTPSDSQTVVVYPIECSIPSTTCDAYLYVISDGASASDVSTIYSTDASTIKHVAERPDLLVTVPCGCTAAGNGTAAFFHDTKYEVRAGDTPNGVASGVFGGLAWNVGGGGLVAGDVIPVHLPCGCGGDMVVSYPVQPGDTLLSIGRLLDSDVGEIQVMNPELTKNPEFLNAGWVLFVPTNVTPQIKPTQKNAKKNGLPIILGISVSVAFLMAGALVLYLCRRNRSRQLNTEDSKMETKNSTNPKSITTLESKHIPHKKVKNVNPFEPERPVTFSLGDVERATSNFDEARMIGQGGYGSVYYGVLGNQEVAIKKMKSSKSKEFYAELKVLCKVHHKNVVELIGYTSGDDHLYVIYEYVQNGSLNEHLHDPLLKGHQPLSWNARAHIALDAARGIEYIHDHAKAQYVHRDIKTSNILLDKGLRAKVADFGLAKLLERTNDEEYVTTCLVGTPGYLPPESVRELQMTTKSDVFAFGVVLAELITGYRALVQDNKKSNKMTSLISIMNGIFQEENPGSELEAIIDRNLKNYPIEEVYKMAEISAWCLNEDAVNRPDMREITVKLSNICMGSIEWEASLGGNSQVFSGVYHGR